MTMLAVVSSKEGIALSADSCVSSGYSKGDKIFTRFDKKGIAHDKIAYMIYNNGNGFKNFNIKYGYPTSKNINELRNFYKDKEQTYPDNINTPLEFVEHMIKNGVFPGIDKSNGNYTGVVVVGYENDTPKLYTFRMADNKNSYIPNGFNGDMYVNHSNGIGYKKIESVASFKHPRTGKDIKVDCFEGYFAVSFASIGENVKSCLIDCFNINILEAAKYSKDLISETIKEMKEKGERFVDHPIDTLIIPLSDSKIWIRNPKEVNGKEITWGINPNTLNV